VHNARVRADPGSVSERIWLVLQRDLAVWLRGLPEPTFATIVLDLTDRGTRGFEVGATPGDSLRETLSLAAQKPANGMKPRVPDRLQLPIGLSEELRSVLGDLERDAGFQPECIVEEVIPEDGAEWVFDDVIAKMAGRRPAEERLQPEDAAFLYEHARRVHGGRAVDSMDRR